jgi:NTE family protein
MSRPYVADYRVGRLPRPRLLLAQVVAASSAFPPVLSPVVLKLDADAWERFEGADLHDRRSLRERLVLTDGGVYDNMGLENVHDRFETVLVSDAGAPLGIEDDAEPRAVLHRPAGIHELRLAEDLAAGEFAEGPQADQGGVAHGGAEALTDAGRDAAV